MEKVTWSDGRGLVAFGVGDFVFYSFIHTHLTKYFELLAQATHCCGCSRDSSEGDSRLTLHRAGSPSEKAPGDLIISKPQAKRWGPLLMWEVRLWMLV